MRKAALHNLGCKVNSYETEAMQQLLEAAGYQIVDFEEKADVYIINTCSVTNVADKNPARCSTGPRRKSGSPCGGCGLLCPGGWRKAPDDTAIDLVIGNNKKAELVQLLEERLAGWEPQDAVIDISAAQEYEALHIERQADHTRAFIKVQDGCNQFCSYCIIPYTRGRVRSRRPEDVEEEVRTLAEKGYQEIVLTGIHLSSYGTDFKEEPQDLLELTKRLHQIPGVKRIRFGSLEPRLITEEFVRELSAMEKICPHFHLSLQSGCDATLKRMNRHYTCEDYLYRCGILRKYFRDPAITTDVIVGFPGETDEEFAETKKFLETVHFYEMHVFKYSRRAGTRADRMPDQVPEPVKTKRSAELLALEKEMSKAYRASFLGRETEVLMEEPVEIGGARYMVAIQRNM
ncbi:MAG: tRNA (N(6)-L-threonylcarbamoyladenosine(37)-C(2))-methylthiotransferase MtaB [Enterocloster sp.]